MFISISRSALYGFLLALTFNGSGCAQTSSTVSKPNIVLIVADDLGYADLGCQGSKDLKTPHIDAIAQSGIRFTNGYVTCPLCSPSRAGMLTGRYQNRFGHEANPGPKAPANFGLPREQKTIANYMKDAGYVTGMFGKWHLGFPEDLQPHHRGFDEFFGFLGGAHNFVATGNPNRPNTVLRNGTTITETRYLTHAFSEEAVDFVTRHKDKAFFLYLAYNAVHEPLQRAPRLEERFTGIENEKRLTFATMLAALDDGVGTVQQILKQHGLEDNTLIIFVSDNGGPTNGNTSLNTPLSGFKGQLREGGIRVPMIISWPAMLPKGKLYEHPAISLDFLPTVLSAAGVKDLPSNLDGINLLDYLTGKNTDKPHTDLFWRFEDQLAMRSENWKVLVNREGKPRLFNLAEDIEEAKDLSETEPERLKKMQSAWTEWNKKNIPPLWIDSRLATSATVTSKETSTSADIGHVPLMTSF
jgi:arylsulfatase A-like enzyme